MGYCGAGQAFLTTAAAMGVATFVAPVLGQCMGLLTERQRQIFSMRYVDGMQTSEIAHELCVSPARVTQVLSESVVKINNAFFQA